MNTGIGWDGTLGIWIIWSFAVAFYYYFACLRVLLSILFPSYFFTVSFCFFLFFTVSSWSVWSGMVRGSKRVWLLGMLLGCFS